MSEQITGEQLEASSYNNDSDRPVECANCGRAGYEEDQICKLVSGPTGIKQTDIYVCPECGSQEVNLTDGEY